MKYLHTYKSAYRIRFSHILLLVCLTVFGVNHAIAGAGKQKLSRFHKSVKSFKATFKQTITNEKGKAMQTSSGMLFMTRPNKFRWNYESPDRQQIVSNGSKLWIFDEELDQVTIKSLKKAMDQTPARVLSENTPIESEFTINDGGNKKGMDWVVLIPKKKGGAYRSIRLGFKKTLAEIIFEDKIGQTTNIRFFDLKENESIKPKMFSFEIPAGVDVIGDKKLVKSSKKASK